MLLRLLLCHEALTSSGMLHPSAPKLMGMVLQPFPGKILLANKNVETRVKNVSSAALKKDKSQPEKCSDTIGAEQMRGRRSCLRRRFV